MIVLTLQSDAFTLVNEDDKQETIPDVDSRDCTASAICGLYGRFFAGPAGYAVL